MGSKKVGREVVADGITHARHAKRAAMIITAGAIAVATVQPVALGLAVGAWAANFCDPDLDHHVHTESETRVYRYNRTLGVLWSLYWWPYQKLMPHRGRSHDIPAGTLDRFVLLFWLPVLLSCYLAPSLWLLLWWLMVFVGQCMVDAVHLWLDGLL